MNNPLGAASQYIVEKIGGDTMAEFDQMFAPQSIEFSQGALNVFNTVTGLQNCGMGAPETYEWPAIAQMQVGVEEAERSLDPPDWNYTTVEPPSPLSLPATGNAVVDQYVSDYLAYASYLAATLHAHERWQGATIAGDTASATLQLNAFNTYSAAADSIAALLPADDQALAQALPPVDVNRFTAAAKTLAAQVSAQCGQPLPANLNSALLGLGLSQDTIDDRVCDVAATVRPSDFNPNFTQLLTATQQ